MIHALEAQHRPRLAGSRYLQRQLFKDAADLCHLLGVVRASLPLPRYRLSSSPTRTLPPMMAAAVTKGIWWRPAASTDKQIVARRTGDPPCAS